MNSNSIIRNFALGGAMLLTQSTNAGAISELVFVDSESNSSANFFSYSDNISTNADSNTIYLTQNEKLPQSHEQSWSSEKKHLVYSLRNLENLRSEWDGYDAVPPKKEAIENAVKFAMIFPRYLNHPNCTPLSSGEISLYWKTKDIYVELGFEGDDTYYAYARDGDKKYRNNSIALNSTDRIPKEILDILLKIG